jgi:3-hydroxyisobutyrate dehydrogenase
MSKDMQLSQAAAASAGAVTPVAAQAASLYADYVAAGNDAEDFSGIINFLRREITSSRTAVPPIKT